MAISNLFEKVNEIKKKSSEYSPIILKFLEEYYGMTPKIYEIMSGQNTELFITHFIKSQSVIKENRSKLSLKIKELIALAAAVAIGSKFCQEVHIKAAVKLGATKDQIFETILISGMIGESSKLALSLRIFEELI